VHAQRKILAATAALVGLTLALSGCSPSAGESHGSYSDKTVSLWYITDAKPIVQQAITRFEAANPGVTVKATSFSDDDLKLKLKVALGTQSEPDIFEPNGGSDIAGDVGANVLAKLDDVVKTNGLTKVMGAGALSTGQYNGVQYGIPVVSDASMIWYNTDIFKKEGLTAPTTWDEFITLIGKLKAGGYVPLAMGNKTQWPGLHWWSEITTLACGPKLIDQIAAGDKGADFTNPCFVEAGKRIQELVKAGAFNPGFNGIDYSTGQSDALFWSGKAAMDHMGDWLIGSAKSEAPKGFESKMAFFNVPAWTGAQGTTSMLTGGVGMMWSLTNKSGDSSNAKKLIGYLSDEKTGQAAADNGRIPMMTGPTISDPVLQKVSEDIAAAPALQLWPDGVFVPSLTTVIDNQVQALFGDEVTPEAAASAMQAGLVASRKK
jgi:raffinose/stachyose/melibiose transport system substrate-binding protein